MNRWKFLSALHKHSCQSHSSFESEYLFDLLKASFLQSLYSDRLFAVDTGSFLVIFVFAVEKHGNTKRKISPKFSKLTCHLPFSLTL